MTPTDADRQRAQDVGREIRKHLFSSRHPNTGAVELGLSWEANDIIAAAIAAARAEGWREGQTDSLTAVANLSSILPAATSLIRAAILNLKEPGHGTP